MSEGWILTEKEVPDTYNLLHTIELKNGTQFRALFRQTHWYAKIGKDERTNVPLKEVVRWRA